MPKPRLIMIGLDGGTFKIIDPLIKEGKLPNLQKLIDTGTKAILKSTIPPITAPAWVTLMTGVNPGKHGLFDFRKLEKITYDMPFNPIPVETCNIMHSRYYAGKTIWDIFSKRGLKVSVLTMPMTYPAWEINGYMLSGYPSPDFKNPTGYPEQWAPSIGHLFDMSTIAIGNEDKLIEECHIFAQKIGDVLFKQIQENECDIYSVVFSSTDFLQHYLWKYLSDGNSKYAHAIQNMYIEIDKIVGRILDLVNHNECSYVILSDHGFSGAPEKFFHTNAWLIKEGYLITKEKKLQTRMIDLLLNPLRYQKVKLRLFLKSYFKYLPSSLQKRISDSYHGTNLFDFTKTKAFRHRIGTVDGVDGIVINVKGRQPSGIVEEKDYEALRSEIIDKLKGICDKEDGTKVVSEVYRREEIYKGQFVDLAPDILFILDSKYGGGVGINNNFIGYIPNESISAISGVHDMDGILLLNGPRFKKKLHLPPVGIVDIFPTILFDLGVPIPTYVDGTIIKTAFKDEFVSMPATYVESPLFEADTHANLSANEEEAMKEALKGLGYLS